MIEDSELLKKILSKDESGLLDLQKKYGKLIYGVVNKIIGFKHSILDVEECYSDIIYVLWNGISSYDNTKGSLINFIVAVSKFKAIDYKRKLDKRSEVELKDEFLGEELFLDVDELESFEELLIDLSNEDKNIFIKRYFFEESIEKIALDLIISKELVYKRLSRGRKKLKEYLEGCI